MYRLFPFLRWLPELRDTKVLWADIVAGVTVAMVLVPQAMAYAELGQFDKALEALDLAIQLEPDDLELRAHRSLFEAGKPYRRENTWSS